MAAEEGDDSPLLQQVSADEIKMNLSKCKNKSAAGNDGINYSLLKRLPDSYTNKLARYFTACIQLGHFPTRWKAAKTILLPKPGKDSRQAKNHRPISLYHVLEKS